LTILLIIISTSKAISVIARALSLDKKDTSFDVHHFTFY